MSCHKSLTTKLVSEENSSTALPTRSFPKAKRQSPLMTQPVISPAATFRRSWQKSTSRPNPRIPRKCLSELLGSVPETTAHVVCSDTKSSNRAGTFREEIALQKMSAISLRSITCQNTPEKLCPNNFESIRELSGRIGERREQLLSPRAAHGPTEKPDRQSRTSILLDRCLAGLNNPELPDSHQC